jgi:type IV secretory pathway TraG/TraD family ATPase VirD4
LLFYDRHLPILARKLEYYSDPEFTGLFTPDPFIRKDD